MDSPIWEYETDSSIFPAIDPQEFDHSKLNPKIKPNIQPEIRSRKASADHGS
jgi:hypothetical protein